MEYYTATKKCEAALSLLTCKDIQEILMEKKFIKAYTQHDSVYVEKRKDIHICVCICRDNLSKNK